MIYCKRIGGLANQMFQIATTYATSLKNNTSWAVSNHTNENINVPTQRNSFNDTILRNIPKQNKPNNLINFREGGFNFSPIPDKSSLFLQGYFQSAKYFNNYRKEILELFYEYYSEVSDYINKIFNQIPNEITVSIHVRRTDYIRLAHTHPTQTIEYYRKAINHIQQTYPDIYLMIFSDDIEWCKNQELFKNFPKKHFMESHSNNSEINTVIDLYCMARCNHNIIANSSFSWWGSYLNNNENKIIIAPKQWFAKLGPKNWQDIYHNMIII